MEFLYYINILNGIIMNNSRKSDGVYYLAIGRTDNGYKWLFKKGREF